MTILQKLRVYFSPVSVEEAVRSMPQLGNEYELIVDKNGAIDRIILKYELAPGYEGQERSGGRVGQNIENKDQPEL